MLKPAIRGLVLRAWPTSRQLPCPLDTEALSAPAAQRGSCNQTANNQAEQRPTHLASQESGSDSQSLIQKKAPTVRLCGRKLILCSGLRRIKNAEHQNYLNVCSYTFDARMSVHECIVRSQSVG